MPVAVPRKERNGFFVYMKTQYRIVCDGRGNNFGNDFIFQRPGLLYAAIFQLEPVVFAADGVDNVETIQVATVAQYQSPNLGTGQSPSVIIDTVMRARLLNITTATQAQYGELASLPGEAGLLPCDFRYANGVALFVNSQIVIAQFQVIIGQVLLFCDE